MSKDRKSSSKSTIKYFLIITAASVLLSIIFSLLRGVGISIFSLLNSTNLVSSGSVRTGGIDSFTPPCNADCCD